MTNDDFSARWERRVRDHSHQVFLSLLALGVAPETAREVVQTTWARLIEKDRAGDLAAGSYVGLAITQARFLALDMRRAQARRGEHESVDDHHELASPASSPEDLAVSRQELKRVREALARCPASVQKIFRLAYTPPPRDHRQIAESIGLSVQRVRQILTETRKRLRIAIDAVPEPAGQKSVASAAADADTTAASETTSNADTTGNAAETESLPNGDDASAVLTPAREEN